MDKSFHSQQSQTGPEDFAHIKVEEAQYIRDRSDLPDIDMTLFESFEDYVIWVMEGRQRFSCQ